MKSPSKIKPTEVKGIKIRLGKYLFQTYPVKETDIPNKWIYFEKIRIFGKTIGCYWLLK